MICATTENKDNFKYLPKNSFFVYKIKQHDEFYVISKDDNGQILKEGSFTENSNVFTERIKELISKKYREHIILGEYQYYSYQDYLKNGEFVIQKGDQAEQIYVVVKNLSGVFYEEGPFENNSHLQLTEKLKAENYIKRECIPFAKRKHLFDLTKKGKFLIFFQEDSGAYFLLGINKNGKAFELGGYQYDEKLEYAVTKLLSQSLVEYTDYIKFKNIILKNKFDFCDICSESQLQERKKEQDINKQEFYRLQNSQYKCCSNDMEFVIIFQNKETKIEYRFKCNQSKNEIKYFTKKEIEFDIKKEIDLNLHEFRIDIEKTIFKDDQQNLFFYY